MSGSKVSYTTTSTELYAEILQGGRGGANLRYLKKEGGAAASSVRGSTGRQCDPPQHIKQCSLSCLMRIAIEAPEELSESDLNEIIDVWQRKSRIISDSRSF